MFLNRALGKYFLLIINWKEVEIPEDKAAQIDERKESAEERKGTSDRESMVSTQTTEDFKKRAQSSDLQDKRESITGEQKAQAQGKQLDRSQVGEQSSTNRLNRDFQARQRGSQRSQSYNSWGQNLGSAGGKSGRSRPLVAAENASRFRFKAFLNFEPLIHKEEK